MRALILLFLSVLPVIAQNVDQRLRYEKYQLSNGLTVILNRDNSAPVVTVEAWYKVGAKDISSTSRGVLQFVNFLMFSGSKNVAGGEHQQLIEDQGGRAFSNIGYDQMRFVQVVPSNALQLTLWLEAERTRNVYASLDSAKYVKARETLSRRRQEMHARGQLNDWRARLFALTFPKDHPYHYPLLCTDSTFTRINYDLVKLVLADLLVPQNIILTISGDINPRQVKNWIGAYFATIPSGEVWVEERVAIPPMRGPLRQEWESAFPNPAIYILFPFPKIGSRESYAMDLLAHIFGNDDDSRLYRALVVDQGIARNVEINPWSMVLNSHMIIRITGAQGVDARTLENSVYRVFDDVAKQPFRKEELERARLRMKGYYTDFVATSQGRSFLINAFEDFWGKQVSLAQEVEKYDDIDLEELRQNFREYMQAKNRYTLVQIAGDSK
jgi:zinc protease